MIHSFDLSGATIFNPIIMVSVKENFSTNSGNSSVSADETPSPTYAVQFSYVKAHLNNLIFVLHMIIQVNKITIL